MPGKIFINYRRGDDPGFTHALYQRLETEFPGGDLFMDVEGHISPGDDFVEVLGQQVGQCDVLLAVIGPRWAELMAARAGDDDDFVAIELDAALRQGKRVIPVLVGGASMPRPDQLPDRVRQLARRNAVGLRPERFRVDCQGLVDVLKEQLAAAVKERTEREAAERAAAEEARRGAESAATQRRRRQAAEAWHTVAASEDVEAFETFLRAWPGSEHAPQGRKRIAELKRQGRAAPKRRAVHALIALAGLAALVAAALVVPWLHPSQPAPASSLAVVPIPSAANTAWMLVSLLVTLVAAIPGIALFYGGLDGRQEPPPFTQVIAVFVVVGVAWGLYGYSLSATESAQFNDFVGGLSKVLLSGVTSESTVETFSESVVIPEYMFAYSQMTMACVATALIAGALVGRMKLWAILLFSVMWATFVYVPISHMFWYWAGPTSVVAASKAVAAASGDAKVVAQAALQAVLENAGLAFRWGALDFAGGAVVYLPAGVAGLLWVLMVPSPETAADQEAAASEGMTLVGALLLAIGCLGMIAGSNLEASTTGVLAVANTLPAAAAAGLTWILAEWALHGRVSPLGFMWGALAGLVAISPAAGFSGPMGAVLLGAGAAAACACALLFFGGADSDSRLVFFLICCVAGLVGLVGTGVVAAPGFGGTGIFDYTTGRVGDYDVSAQVMIQAKAAGLSLAWSGAGSLALLLLLRASHGAVGERG